MASVVDVAESILTSLGPMDTFRLQKLVYYSQAVHLARTGEPLFAERIEAWSNGPCAPVLYSQHRGSWHVATVGGDGAALGEVELASVRRTSEYYGSQDSQWLVNQTHLEDPWRDARRGVPEGARSDHEITVAAIRDYYAPILDDPELIAALASVVPGGGLTAEEIDSKYRRYRQ